ncbi:MAG: serine protease [Planctomycetes bacterium]|nr:serine protease [Planctomycetota bacterium]
MIPKHFFFCFWSILGVLVLNGVTEAKESRDIAKQAFPSVVMLVMEDNSGQPLSLGSGFFVREDIVATNLHVVEGAAGGYAKIVGEKQKYDIAGYVAIDNKMDLVLLKINDVKAPAITLGDSSKIAIGDEIFAVGNPKGLEGTFSKGIVSAIRKIEEDTLLQITAPISPGSSGGPILNSEGNVIGISVATFKGGQNLNFAIPVSYLSNLLVNIKSAKLLSVEEKSEKKVKSILVDLGGRSTEGVRCTQFLWDTNYDNEYMRNQGFTFSISNSLNEPIKDVIILLVFYDKQEQPIESVFASYEGIVSPRSAKRVSSFVEYSIKRLTTKHVDSSNFDDIPYTKVEFRILNFQIVEEEM